MGVTQGSIYCHRCSYVLDGLDRERCPECGKPYDPTDRATYETMPRWARWRRRLFRCCIVLAVLGMLSGAAYAACRIPPSLRVVEVVKDADSRWCEVTVVLKNRSLRPACYLGYLKTPLTYTTRYGVLGGKTWRREGGGSVWTGPRPIRLMPGESVTFSATLYGFDDPPPDRVQVGMWLWGAGQNTCLKVWSDTFALRGGDQSDAKVTTAGGRRTGRQAPVAPRGCPTSPLNPEH